MLPYIKYFGHCISKDGLQYTDNKIRDQLPTNASKLKSFYGLLKIFN